MMPIGNRNALKRPLLMLVLLAIGQAAATAADDAATNVNASEGKGFTTTVTEDRLVISCDGAAVGDFVFADRVVRRPGFQNLHAPDGTKVTRRHPPEPGKDATDHADMHPGLWMGFGDISGEDFWRNKGTIRHDQFVESPAVRSGRLEWSTASTLVSSTGMELARQTARFTLARKDQAYLLTWEADFVPLIDGFSFGDQEEMGLGVRVATPLTEKSGGLIVTSTGDRSAKATWGKSYAWCDYSGTIDGRRAGVAIVPYPQNFRPCWWHNRDYGVFVANPFGRKALTQGAASRVDVPRGESFSLRFAVLLHSGPAESPFDVAAACRRFLDEQSNPAR